jgi:hypothetical protein
MATVGAKRKRSTLPPPKNLGPYLRHPVHTNYVGWSDGKIWSTKSEKFLMGTISDGGYPFLSIGGGHFLKHRFNFEIAHQRPVAANMDIDHTNGDKKDGSWSNLQELTRAEHLAKTRMDNPQSARVAETRGQRLVATHIETGKELLFVSQLDAAKELGVPPTTLWGRLKDEKQVGPYTIKVICPRAPRFVGHSRARFVLRLCEPMPE